MLNFPLLAPSDVAVVAGAGVNLRLATVISADANGTLLSGSRSRIRFITPPALVGTAGATITFRLSSAATGSAARTVILPFVYDRPRASPPVVMDLSPITAAAGSPLALTVRLAGVPDPDPAVSFPGAAAGTPSGGWLPGVSVVVTDPAGSPRPISARLLWADGAGGSSIAVTAAANVVGVGSAGWGGGFDDAGVWNVTVTMELDSGSSGTVAVSVVVVDIPPPQARMQTPVLY
jgi:hypothetical protein